MKRHLCSILAAVAAAALGHAGEAVVSNGCTVCILPGAYPSSPSAALLAESTFPTNLRPATSRSRTRPSCSTRSTAGVQCCAAGSSFPVAGVRHGLQRQVTARRGGDLTGCPRPHLRWFSRLRSMSRSLRCGWRRTGTLLCFRPIDRI